MKLESSKAYQQGGKDRGKDRSDKLNEKEEWKGKGESKRKKKI